MDEVESICGVGEDAEYSFDNMNKLKYTHRVFLEVLRLYPTVPGAVISLSYYSMGRSEEIWGKDAHEFNPERFLENREPSSFMFPAFHAGPRVCLGKPLAFMNMKLVLSMLLTSGLDFKDRDGHSGKFKYGLNLTMKDSFPIEILYLCDC